LKIDEGFIMDKIIIIALAVSLVLFIMYKILKFEV